MKSASLGDRPPAFAEVVRGKLEFVKMVRGVGDQVYRHLQTRFVRANPDYLAVMEEENRIMNKRDIFISHASEDKDDFVRPLAQALIKVGVSVWYDEYEIQVGDSIRAKVDEGLSRSRFGVVVLSPSFFAKAKTWPQRELDGLVSGEDATGTRRILPVWHKLDFMAVQGHSPALAGIRALDTSKESLSQIVGQLLRKLKTP
ncbi:MAG: toll/interleukin-1 receptor domain-containing protein [Isosphaeraceae bacterium]